MSWGYCAVAAAAVVSSVASAQSGKDSAINGLNSQSAQTNAQIERANLQSIVRNSYRSAILNMQLGQAKQVAVKRGFDTGVAADVAYSAANANQAAVGAVGASAKAILSDVQMRLGEEQARQADDMNNTLISYNNELDMMRVNALNESYAPANFRYTGPSDGQIGSAGIMAGLSAVASSYLGSKLSLGSGGGASSSSGLGSGISMPSGGSTPGFSAGDLGGGLRLR